MCQTDRQNCHTSMWAVTTHDWLKKVKHKSKVLHTNAIKKALKSSKKYKSAFYIQIAVSCNK